MTSEETRLFIKRYCEMWEREDVRGLAACYTEHAHVDSPMFHALDGREAIAKSFTDLFQAFTDSKIGIEDIIVDNETGDRCVIVWTSQGTHRGMLFGLPGSGRRVEVSGAFMMKFENGLIVRERRLYDFVGMLVQLGVLKTRAV
jgi:steroid delta-isomerase-like uncharacterized protein